MDQFTVDPADSRPPYEQLRIQIAARISSGALPPGTRLPTVRALAAELGLAVNTVAKTYRALETDGIVVTEGRRGTFVPVGHRQRAASEAAGRRRQYVAVARRLGLGLTEATGARRAALVRRAPDCRGRRRPICVVPPNCRGGPRPNDGSTNQPQATHRKEPAMPLFMDVHDYVDGLTAEAVAGAHAADLATQEKYGVKYRSLLVRRELGQGVLPRRGSRRGRRHPGPPRGPRPRRRPRSSRSRRATEHGSTTAAVIAPIALHNRSA